MIELVGVTKSYGNKKALNNLNLTIEAGNTMELENQRLSKV